MKTLIIIFTLLFPLSVIAQTKVRVSIKRDTKTLIVYEGVNELGFVARIKIRKSDFKSRGYAQLNATYPDFPRDWVHRIYENIGGKESSKHFGAIQTWDNQIVSWGFNQYAGKAGSLGGLMDRIKKECPAEYIHYFHNFAGFKKIKHLKGIKASPKKLLTMILAGNVNCFQLAQYNQWKSNYYDRPMRLKYRGKRLDSYLTKYESFRKVARVYNWGPSTLKKWTKRFFIKHPIFNETKYSKYLTKQWAIRKRGRKL